MRPVIQAAPRSVRIQLRTGNPRPQRGNFCIVRPSRWMKSRIDSSNASGTKAWSRALCRKADVPVIGRSVGGAPVAAYIKSMDEIINLRRVRKAKARAAAEADAAANRAAHGRPKAERNLSKAQQEADARKLDGHKRDDD